ncbi:uncharacterized protein Triagg1_7765 [Trichoderma aggressivum f. europaeum]|uniref:Uncharacterized protein n=1 Tax=Trichoderma aggressivum f. europaeum TaxID=173218 RepID=A0AAE1LWP0_9HYPO|nr:hypothetical protein Triagg1_7765 [Trichoderma aggressivum f. europaeum]
MVPNADQNVLIPIKLDAFVLNDKVCDGGHDDDELRARKAKMRGLSKVTAAEHSTENETAETAHSWNPGMFLMARLIFKLTCHLSSAHSTLWLTEATRERGFDGLVGYFPPLPQSKLEEDNALDLSTFYIHFPPGVHDTATKELAKISPPASAYEEEQPNPTLTEMITIKKDNYPLPRPYYSDPDKNDLTPSSYTADANEKLAVFGALLDPFLPVHAYTGILPVKELSLPTWTWQGALDKLSAFFHAGPVLITGDVPGFVEARQLKQGDLPPKVVEGVEGEEKQAVGLPGGALGMWSWLQPYDVEGEHGKNTRYDEEEEKPRERFMPLAVEVLGEESRLEWGPYTAIEGLQMAAGVNEK